MAKSIRSKREKRLRAIRREIVEPFYDKKDAAKLAAQEAALAAPKLPVHTHNSNTSTAMDTTITANTPMGMPRHLIIQAPSFNHPSPFRVKANVFALVPCMDFDFLNIHAL